MVSDARFAKFPFLLKNSNFVTGNILSVIFLEVAGSLCTIQENSYQVPQSGEKPFRSVILSDKSDVPWKWLVHLTTEVQKGFFPSNKHHTSASSTGAPQVLPILSHGALSERHMGMLKGCHFLNVVILTTSFRHS